MTVFKTIAHAWRVTAAALLMVVLISGCPDKKDKTPKIKHASGVAKKIDLAGKKVSMMLKGDDGVEREAAGTYRDDVEIFVNGRAAKVADVREGDKIEVTYFKDPVGDGEFIVKKVEVARAGETDWKPTAKTDVQPVNPPVNPPPVDPPKQETPKPPPTTDNSNGNTTSEADLDKQKTDLTDYIYAQIRVKMEEALAKRAELIKAGTALGDPSIQDLERQILRARALLAERGEILEDVKPPLQVGGGAPAPTTQPAG